MISLTATALELTVFWAKPSEGSIYAYGVLNRAAATEREREKMLADAQQWVVVWTGGRFAECAVDVSTDVMHRAAYHLDQVDRSETAHLVVAQRADGTFDPFGLVTRDEEIDSKELDLSELVGVAREETVDGQVLIVPLPINLEQIDELFQTPKMTVQ